MPDNIFEKEKELFLHTYNRIPVEIERGEGVHLIDKNGNRYLDFFSGLAVNALGYSHPKIISAVAQQMMKFSHLSNSFITDVQVELAEMLIRHSGMSKIFFSNSGAEAIEGAIKLVRKVYGPEKKIFALTNSFHGRTYGALTLTNREKYQKGFEPLLPNIDKISFNEVSDLEEKINDQTAAVFLEFIQGEGGINLVSDSFAEKLIHLRDSYGFVIVADEIQTGIGRTGKEFAFNHYAILPDILITAKAIGGGLPLGAFLTSSKFDEAFKTGNHGTTFGGNPVCCAAGIAVVKEVLENGLMQNAAELGNYFISELNLLKEKFPERIREVRGRGFMIGVEMKESCAPLVKKMLERKVLTNCTNDNVVRILPPLIARKADIDFYLYNFNEIIKE